MVIEVQPPWRMYFNGAAHRGGAGAGVVFVTSQGEVLPYSFTLTQLCSNNVAEYQALILGLKMAVKMKRLQLQVFGDSQLVINQLLGSYEVKKLELRQYHDYAKNLMGWVGDMTIQHMPRKENKKADVLAALASSLTLHDRTSYSEKEEWQKPIIGYLSYEILPENPRRRAEIRRRAPLFLYYKDAIYGRCKACQFHANFIHQPPEVLHPTVASWPFDAWGLDVVGPLPKSDGGHLYILAATDYFSKWAEVVALKEVKKENVASFI
ncbi:uncharacterized protein [Nicotiana tomentosiformis]|uniref:uncharacterized protein n=1 Tax=Nicotiana tomentosiformis TaxID=4098 RepID=UPI00388C5B91